MSPGAEFFQPLEASALAVFLRRSQTAYIFLNAGHILSIGLVIGSIAALDLRLLGAFRARPLAALAPPLSSVAAVGVVMALATGFLLFSVRPGAYAANAAFQAKLALVALAVVNALLVRAGGAWPNALAGAIGFRLRAQAALSLLLWASALLAGRWIGFLQ